MHQNGVDILFISETHFTTKSHFVIPGYTFYSTNHPDEKAHGGTAILIKPTIAHHVLLPYATAEIQATSINVRGPFHDIVIAAVYCPPRYNPKAAQFERFFRSLEKTFIAGGDYNSKNILWGSRLTTTKGRELEKTLQTNHYATLSIGSPTYWPTDIHKVPDPLDFFVTSGISPSYIDIKPSYELSSDHTPILLTISTSVTPFTPAPGYIREILTGTCTRSP